MDNTYYFLQASPLGFCQNPYSFERNLPFGTEERTIELKKDGGTKFSVYAPKAKSVDIEFMDGSHRFALEKDHRDIWSLILYDIPPGLHYMKWYFNDIEMINKEAPILYGFGGACNFVEIPQKHSHLYYLQNVPHGSLRMEYYVSSFSNEIRTCMVYTPPSYDFHPERRYPVLYALNGKGENETAWSMQGRIHLILDNLIAQKLCCEMIVVMNSGIVFSENNQEIDGDIAMMDNFSRLLMVDCIPFIENKFRTISDKMHRAVCGVSLGASQAQWLALHYPETVDSVGVFGGRLLNKMKEQTGHCDLSAFFETLRPEEFNAEYHYFLYARGIQEGGEQLKREVLLLQRQGFAVDSFLDAGGDDWNFWRKAIKEFIIHLFRKETKQCIN